MNLGSSDGDDGGSCDEDNIGKKKKECCFAEEFLMSDERGKVATVWLLLCRLEERLLSLHLHKSDVLIFVCCQHFSFFSSFILMWPTAV